MKQLERFVVTAESGNVGAAAARLSLSQPALTRSIHLLEQSVGAPLFDRMARGVKLTELGAKILPYAYLMVRERAGLMEIVDESKGRTGGLVRFGVTGNLEGWAAASIAILHKTRPEIRFSISTGAVSGLFAKLQAGSLDLALSMVGHHALPENIVFEPLFDRVISIVARTSHPLDPGFKIDGPQFLGSDFEFFVVEGAIETNGKIYGRSFYGVHPAGYAHNSFSSAGGATMLVITGSGPDVVHAAPPTIQFRYDRLPARRAGSSAKIRTRDQIAGCRVLTYSGLQERANDQRAARP